MKVVRTCKFCGDKETPYKISSCYVRKRYQLKGREYEISNQNNLNDLCTIIKNDMPLAKRLNKVVLNPYPILLIAN